MEDILNIDFQYVNAKEFTDFLHVMGVVRPRVQLINYLKLIRNTYVRLPILIEMSKFKSHFTNIPFNDENAANLI